MNRMSLQSMPQELSKDLALQFCREARRPPAEAAALAERLQTLARQRQKAVEKPKAQLRRR